MSNADRRERMTGVDGLSGFGNVVCMAGREAQMDRVQ
jgi:hypothetical protein